MNIRWNKTILALVTLLSLASIIGALAYAKSVKQGQQSKFHQPAAVTEAPPVISKIKGLEITSVRLANQRTAGASLEIDVTNNRESDVMCLDFVSGNIERGKEEYSGLGFDGLLEEGVTRIVIPRHSLKTFNWYLGAIMTGETVFLAAAVFADGKEEGDQGSLDGLKIHRRTFQQKQREAKTGGQQ